jgi:hypothetical protein
VDAVYDIRRSFQKAMEQQFKTVVEGAMGRSVIAYMSQIHHDPDLAVELFVLEPSGEDVVALHESQPSAHADGRPAHNGRPEYDGLPAHEDGQPSHEDGQPGD